MSHDGEIVGLNSSSNGRACEQHVCCGRGVRVSDVMKLKLGVVTLDDGSVETVIKGILIKDGMETCMVSFLPRHVAVSERKRGLLVGKFAQIIELYDLSKSASKKMKCTWNQGMACFHLFDDIPEQE